MKQDIINYLTGKSILILGYGREGKSALNFIQQNLPDANLAIADQKALDLVDAKTFSGENYLEHVKEFDIIIKSPGIPTRDFVDDDQLSKITSLTDLFLRFCQNPIIGVTGTKGKSTTSSLTCHLLKEAGRDAILVGNIGIACFDAIDLIKENTIIVFEISCHQLEFVQASPHVAILLNLYEEHLDHYKSAEDYYNAKKSIYKYQGTNDTLIYGDIFQHASREEIANLPMHKIDIYHDIDIPKEEIHTHLVGDHNLYDIYAAVAACKVLELKLFLCAACSARRSWSCVGVCAFSCIPLCGISNCGCFLLINRLSAALNINCKVVACSEAFALAFRCEELVSLRFACKQSGCV